MGSKVACRDQLFKFFSEINEFHFDGFLDQPHLLWNARLRSSAGQFIPGNLKLLDIQPPRIEIATHLIEKPNSAVLIYDTLAHEMIHYWLWVRGRPFGHTSEFLLKMKQMGVSRYNPVNRLKGFDFLYFCKGCRKQFPTNRKLGLLACEDCCKIYSNGKYDSRFQLVLSQSVQRFEFL